MKIAKAKAAFFNAEGRPLTTLVMTLPEYLDWMPIEVKVFWFVARGYGKPDTKHVLLDSQGEQRLIAIEHPLTEDRHTVKENEHDLEDKTNQYIENKGISRVPRNQ